MRKVWAAIAVTAVVMLAWGGFAYAAGGEGNNTGCNGQGNPNSPCQQVNNGGNGGNGGQGGSGGTAKSKANATAVSVSGSTAQSNASANGVYTGSYVGGDTSVKVDGTSFERYAPGASAPALTSAGTGVCLGSVSVGLSGPMAGASFGITKVDKGCERRSGAALLYQMGFKQAAVHLLAMDDDVYEALVRAGNAQPKEKVQADEPTTPGTASNKTTSAYPHNAP